MFMRSEKAPTTAKKSRRSNSPRAIELRRLQNRISQRNHRRRVREARQETNGTSITYETKTEIQQPTEDKSSDPQNLSQEHKTDDRLIHSVRPCDSQQFASSCPDSPLFSPLVDTMIMADDIIAQQEQSWPYLESTMRAMPMENESRMSQRNFVPQSCTCNATTGPCPSHLEKIRAQLLTEATSSLQLRQQHQNHHTPNADMTKAHTLPPSPMSHYSHSTSIIVTSSNGSQRPLYVGHGSTQMGQRPAQAPSIMSHMSKSSSSRSSHISSPPDLSPAILADTTENSSTQGRLRASTTSTAENTRRFGIVLESMRTAGFHDFDGMALAYYTARFEVGSFPAMAQCASRSRRMKAMLQELQENSSQWPRWESRGLHESSSEATVSLCLEEMERLNITQMPNQSLQSEPSNLITAIEWLLESNGQGDLSILEELGLSGKMDSAPDSMPHLWSLLTELAGSRGLYCDRIARLVMVACLWRRGEMQYL
ncbi:hypothetical protein K504DRAFT_450012 [Pleomassaria siparia CBS 279.74]|uniref:BZIP domain-containing protein n=1 Tax=Pleomassaria siparia CBS 279.74 TaxID=1314801 RepID=A0A6G1KKD3_9PLEO|nr:hypothetical protein K504DRAFT_450012 [Pleomassaria siparia CBS 279.74]